MHRIRLMTDIKRHALNPRQPHPPPQVIPCLRAFLRPAFRLGRLYVLHALAPASAETATALLSKQHELEQQQLNAPCGHTCCCVHALQN